MDEVFNQSGELNDYDLFSSHSAPVDACTAAARETLSGLGERLGSAAMFALGDAANRNPPLRSATDHEALITRCLAPHSP
jgi:Adaptive response protein AidB N-terminal domain